MPYEKLLGFDTRIDPEDPIMYWDSQRRERYLLHPTIDYPLSIDSYVWPSAISGPDYPDLSVSFSGFDFWRSLDEMKSVFHGQETPEPMRGVAVAMLLMSQRPDDVMELWPRFEYLDLPIDLMPKDWLFLGYDIADRGCISGLSNCGYHLDEKEDLQRVWNTRLNENGLIADISHAFEFREITDIRVREHAPFYVLGLYRDPQLWNPGDF